MPLSFLPGGDIGTRITLGHMQGMVRREFLSPQVRLLAAQLVAGCGRGNGQQAYAIRDFVERHTQFLRDPSNTEMLHGPLWQLRQIQQYGSVQVDCDDVAMLSAALGLSIGLRARFIVAAFGGPKAPYQHVWTELADPNSSLWVECDITRPSQGFAFNSISRTLRWEV